MPDLDASSDADDPVGVVLARLRGARHMTGARLASLVGMSQPKISRIERGRGTVDPDDVGVIARALGADERQIADLVERAAEAQDRTTYGRPTMDTLPGRQLSMIKWESSATVIRDFESALVPGLLQTSGYAKAVLLGFQRIAPTGSGDLAEAAVLAAISERMRRQEILADRSRTFVFVLTESVLLNEICPPAEMLAQIEHLRALSGHDNITIRIVLDWAAAGVPPLHGFVVHDDARVIVDVYNTGLYSRSKKDIDSYRRVFGAFEGHAAPIEPTLDRYRDHYIDRLHPPR